MKHNGTKTLETERLILRRFTPDDAEPMFRNWASDPAVTKYLTWNTHEDLYETENLLAAWCAVYQDPAIYNWAIELRESGQAVGNISVVNRSDRDRCCEIGYCLSAGLWRQGIMPEAARAVVRFLLLEVGYHRVGAWHDIRNPASGRVMQKCGMVYEGTMRDRIVGKDGNYSDLCFYGITRDQLNEEGENRT